jgi:hypothetical protein
MRAATVHRQDHSLAGALHGGLGPLEGPTILCADYWRAPGVFMPISLLSVGHHPARLLRRCGHGVISPCV